MNKYAIAIMFLFVACFASTCFSAANIEEIASNIPVTDDFDTKLLDSLTDYLSVSMVTNGYNSNYLLLHLQDGSYKCYKTPHSMRLRVSSTGKYVAYHLTDSQVALKSVDGRITSSISAPLENNSRRPMVLNAVSDNGLLHFISATPVLISIPLYVQEYEHYFMDYQGEVAGHIPAILTREMKLSPDFSAISINVPVYANSSRFRNSKGVVTYDKKGNFLWRTDENIDSFATSNTAEFMIASIFDKYLFFKNGVLINSIPIDNTSDRYKGGFAFLDISDNGSISISASDVVAESGKIEPYASDYGIVIDENTFPKQFFSAFDADGNVLFKIVDERGKYKISGVQMSGDGAYIVVQYAYYGEHIKTIGAIEGKAKAVFLSAEGKVLLEKYYNNVNVFDPSLLFVDMKVSKAFLAHYDGGRRYVDIFQSKEN